MNLRTKRQEAEDRNRLRDEAERDRIRWVRCERLKDFLLIGAGTLMLGVMMWVLLILLLSIDLGPQPGDGEPAPTTPHTEENR